MIKIPIEFECDDQRCVVSIRIMQTPGVNAIPSKVTTQIGGLPPGWTLHSDGKVYCPEHEQRRVMPASFIPDLKALNGRRQ